MFERLCALIFRLYPLEFRRSYGVDAWQLIRDRARVERGPWLRTRLLFDLLRDIFATSLRGWRPGPALAAIPGPRDGTPSFHIIESHGPRPQSIAMGMMTSFVMWASFTLLFQPVQMAEGPVNLTGSAADASSDPGGDEDDRPVTVDIAAARREVIDAVAARLKERYFDRAAGHKLGNALLTFAKNGAYNKVGIGQDLARRLTTHIYETGRTLGIPQGVAIADVVFIENPMSGGLPPGIFRNCSLMSIETMRRNVGYVKLNAFAPPHLCRDAIARAMATVNDSNALILDLRDNGGGIGESALQIASYLFDRPAVMFDPRPHSRVPTHTVPMPASRLIDKPVYILTSSTTRSAAEYFVYNLKMHQRVTIVGERTGGEQHSGVFHPIGDHFGVAIQEVAPPPSPFPVKGWELIGVDPDVRVPSDMALRTALRLANSR